MKLTEKELCQFFALGWHNNHGNIARLRETALELYAELEKTQEYTDGLAMAMTKVQADNRALLERLEKAEGELTDIRATLKPIYHILGIDSLGQLKSTVFTLKDQLAGL